jgi:hypothetical protein
MPQFTPINDSWDDPNMSVKIDGFTPIDSATTGTASGLCYSPSGGNDPVTRTPGRRDGPV